MSSHARLGNISKKSRDLGYTYLDGFKLNKLYIFRIYKSRSLAWKVENVS